MAQDKRASHMRRLHVMARRFGFVVPGGVGVVAAALVVIVSVIGACGLMATPDGVQIERSESTAHEVTQEAEDSATSVDAGAKETEDTRQQSQRVLVHVDGAVARPGVYVLEGEDARVNDAVASAGGLAEEADTSVINLAAPVSDGQKIHIPTADEVAVGETTQPISMPDESGTAGQGAAQGSGLVNLNTAGSEELCSLPGVGEATAAAIMEDRESNGPFATPEDLMRVSGIGEKKFARIKDLICV